ncbi:hypothetical protein BBJ28_00020977 [Nothophytophthora sp. Chile5]|nr:hypothetical protein BBJ28_00020977 [Nothophytophthora sp. Chile5]
MTLEGKTGDHWPTWSFCTVLVAVGMNHRGRGNTCSTVFAKLSAVRWYHRTNLGYDPGLNTGHALLLKGIRLFTSPVLKQQPLTVAILCSVCVHPNPTQSRSQPVWGGLLLNRRAMEPCLADPSPLPNELGTEGDRAEAVVALQFEARNHPHAQSSARTFRREAGIWFELNHANLIKLLGACHEGRPFFVCEPANEGTLVEYLKGKNLETIWVSLLGAAKGLQHLHDLGIVHGDLKGNNILVCKNNELRDVVKLADFGLSVYANREPSNSEGALGAFRWKAPECLRGEGPTLASDVFAFGMCVIEAVTGGWPWGKLIPDEAVKSHVLQKKLPMRPKCFMDREWDLVERMCCFEPKDRLSIGAAIVILDDIQRGYQEVDYDYGKVDW